MSSPPPTPSQPAAATDGALIALAAQVGGPLLALDTSAPQASLVVVLPAQARVVERQLQAASLPSESVVAGIEALLADAQLRVPMLAALVVGLGPGSFTGLRVGLATIKGLALGGSLPVYGVSSLQMLTGAVGTALGGKAAPVYVVAARDARREALYAGLYAVYPGGGSRPILSDAVWTLASLTRAVGAALGDAPAAWSQLYVVGDAAKQVAVAWGAQACDVSPQSRYGLAAAAGALAAGHADDLATLTPRYMRGDMTETLKP